MRWRYQTWHHHTQRPPDRITVLLMLRSFLQLLLRVHFMFLNKGLWLSIALWVFIFYMPPWHLEQNRGVEGPETAIIYVDVFGRYSLRRYLVFHLFGGQLLLVSSHPHWLSFHWMTWGVVFLCVRVLLHLKALLGTPLSFLHFYGLCLFIHWTHSYCHLCMVFEDFAWVLWI